MEVMLKNLLANEVTSSYRSDRFSRIKPKNLEKINDAINKGEIKVLFNSNVIEIFDNKVVLEVCGSDKRLEILNNLVYIFAGGELPTKFLEKIGIEITTKFGEALLKH